MRVRCETDWSRTLSGMARAGRSATDTRPRTMPAPKRIAFAIAAICAIGLVANQAQAAALAAGIPLSLQGPTGVGWQYAREGLTVLLLAVLLAGVFRARRRASVRPAVSLPMLGFAAFLLVTVGRTLIYELQPLSGVLTGLRFVYIGAIALCVRYYDAEDRRTLLKSLSAWLAPLILVEAVIAAIQVRTGLPTMGATFLGSRPWGTYSSANNLGLAMLAFAAIVTMARNRYWRTLTVISGLTCLATGSRTGIIGFFLIITGLALARWRSRWLMVPVIGVLVYAVYTFASSTAVSGRTLDGEARFATWSSVWSALHGWWDKLLGAGVGAGTNAQATHLGSARLAGYSYTDSAVLATALSVGVVGAVWLLVAYGWAWREVEFRYRFLLLPVLGLCSLSFNVPEVAPFNLLLAVAIGVALPEPLPRNSGSGVGVESGAGEVVDVGGADRVRDVGARDHRGGQHQP